MTDYGSDLVVKEQGDAKQMLVRYGSILTGESSAILGKLLGSLKCLAHARHTADCSDRAANSFSGSKVPLQKEEAAG